MRKLSVLLIAIALLLTLSACNSPAAPTTQPTTAATLPVAATATSNATAVVPSATTIPATLAPTSQPAATQPPPTNTSAPSGSNATATWAGTDEVLIYLIAMEDNGVSGPKVGCGDSAVPIRRSVQNTRSPLRVAIETLLAMKDPFFGESGYYNALHQSSLVVDDVNIDANGTAIIRLSGHLQLVGTCEDPRIKAQLEYTALQFSTVKAVQITVNGEDLDDIMDMSGG